MPKITIPNFKYGTIWEDPKSGHRIGCLDASEKKEIVRWFKMVCEGIRQEYERGASHRKLEVDATTLKELLRL